jgi:hypothetical protein
MGMKDCYSWIGTANRKHSRESREQRGTESKREAEEVVDSASIVELCCSDATGRGTCQSSAPTTARFARPLQAPPTLRYVNCSPAGSGVP